MSRPLRIDYPNAWHHVMNRDRRGQDLFVDKADYQQFFKKKIDNEVPESKELAPDLETIISEVSRYYEIRPTTLKGII